jgi:hypothetical protein
MERNYPTRLLDEICKNGTLEDYRTTLDNILTTIHQSGCKVSTKYNESTSSFERYREVPARIRIRLAKIERPLDVIWELLHEYGHFLSQNKKALSKVEREELAWEHADRLLPEYPDLLKKLDEYTEHKTRCLSTYYEAFKREHS